MQPLPQALGSPRGRGGSGSPSSPFVLVLVAQAQSSDPQCWKPWSTFNKLLPKFGLLSNRHGLFGWRTGALSAGKHWSCRMMLTRSQKWCLSVNQVVCVDRAKSDAYQSVKKSGSESVLPPETSTRLKAGHPSSLAPRPSAPSAVLVLSLIVTRAGYLGLWNTILEG